MALIIHPLITGKWKENCYIIHNNNLQALIIDPGSDEDQIVGYIETQQLKPIAILNTHGHYDHIGAVAGLIQHYSLPFYLHSEDFKFLKYANLFRKLFDDSESITLPAKVDHYLDKIENPLILGDYSIEIIFTPGHTPGSVCFLSDGNLFSGDTLFRGNVGRVDLPGGNEEALQKSLINLSTLSPDLCIYPGHGQTTTLSEELKNNPAFLEFKNENSH